MRVLVVLAVLALLCKHVDSFHQPRLWFGNMKHRQSSRRLCAMVNSGGFVDDIKQGGLARTLLGLAVGTGLALQPLAANADIDTTSSTPVVAEIAVAESNSVGDSITAKAALPTEGLLKATLRGERSASPAPVKKANILKALQSSSLPSISIDTNAVNVDNLRSALRALPKQWPYLAAVGVAVFVADSVQYNKQLKENVDEQLDQIESLRKKLAASESEGISKEEGLQMMQSRASALQQELAALTSQLDLSSKEIQTLKKAIEKLSNNEQLIRDLEAEAGRLRGEVRALEQIRDNPSSLPVVKALKEQIAMMIERDQLLIQKLKEFLTTNEFLPEGIANMLLVATAPQMLDDILSKGQQQKQVESVTLPAATLHHPEDEAKIHEQSKQINALQSDVDKLKASAAKLEDTLAAYSQDFSQWIEKQSPELLAWMKAKDISSHKFSTNVLQEVVQFYHEKVQESHATNAQKVAQEGTEEAKKLQQQLASREQEMQTMQSTLKQSESTLHSNAERISVLEASQQSLEAQLKQEQHKSKTLSVELEEASKQPPAVAAAAAAAAAVPSVTTSSTSAKKSSKSTASSTSEDDSSEKVKKLESNLESAKVMAKELRNRLGEKELEYNQMVAECKSYQTLPTKRFIRLLNDTF